MLIPANVTSNENSHEDAPPPDNASVHINKTFILSQTIQFVKLCVFFGFVLFAFPVGALAQVQENEGEYLHQVLPYSFHSGVYEGPLEESLQISKDYYSVPGRNGERLKPVYEHRLEIPEARSLQLHFSAVSLGKNSVLRICSVTEPDNCQHHTAATLEIVNQLPSNGATIFVYGGIDLNLYGSTVVQESSPSANPVIHATMYSNVHLGYAILSGGKIYISNNSGFLGGLYSGGYPNNHLCLYGSAHLETASNSYLYAKSDWWKTYPPIHVGSSIYHSSNGSSSVCSALKSGGSNKEKTVFNSVDSEFFDDPDPLGQILVDRSKKNYNQAVASLKELILHGDPNDTGTALGILGQLLVRHPGLPQPLSLLNEVESQRPDLRSQTKILRALSFVNNYPQTSISLLEEIRTENSDRKNTFYTGLMLAQLYAKRGDTNQSESALLSTLPVTPEEQAEWKNVRWLLNQPDGYNKSGVGSDVSGLEEYPEVSALRTREDELDISVYPNPFNPTTNISFSLSERSEVDLSVFDLLGRRTSQIVNETLAPGTFQYVFDAKNLSTGTMIIRLSVDDKVYHRLVSIVK